MHPGTLFSLDYSFCKNLKEKCFLVKPLMRSMHERGELTGAAAALMNPLPEEEFYDTEADPHEMSNLATDPA